MKDATAEIICALAVKWLIEPRLAVGIFTMAARAPFALSIISGYRTAAEQEELRKAGRPTAPDELSTHRTCPATGADLLVGIAVTNVVKAMFGELAVSSGLRWGGGSVVDPQTGIPLDWNHVDLGPR